ncbi:MAG: hypothetical protein TR69_WS6001000798 [candidate division WS6 bacterium OLB20]|uniref:Uncharacterized protein n=1 Tax=candidate division WS6 bacterium OLB20 TaxID=1617426 RepID=A0A136LYV9_9BACT|nr:MAG: hypothetical protein TR69_WS6001000798 [candidate division WS6 bacterium OLB20]
MDAKTKLEEFRTKIEPLLEEYFETVAPHAKTISPESYAAVKYLREYSLRKAKTPSSSTYVLHVHDDGGY